MLNASTWSDIQRDRDILYSFPYWMTQLVGDDQSASMQCLIEYEPYIPVEIVADADQTDKEMNENAESEKEILNELKRFYVEKFQGHILREYDENGNLKSETEIKEGKRHGRHREYFPDGKLKIRGKYIANQPKGTWKYYTEEGKLEQKKKF